MGERKDRRRVVLITGCSTGLGAALCRCLAAVRESGGSRSFRVFASARRIESLSELSALGIESVRLDVRDQQSIKQAVDSILEKAGHIDILINNAGFSSFGPLIEQDVSRMASVMDTNAFGTVRVTQAVAPAMVARREGLILNIGSVTCNFTTCFAGAYSASKAAQRAFTDALRVELRPFGVRVVWVQAGSITTNFSFAAENNSSLAEDSLYRLAAAGFHKRIHSAEGKGALSPEETAKQIVEKAILIKRTPTMIKVGGWARIFTVYGFVQQWVHPWLVELPMAHRFGLAALQKEMARCTPAYSK
eukprot:jgi/Botrbrau1/12165/Bobra.0186s0073.1